MHTWGTSRSSDELPFPFGATSETVHNPCPARCYTCYHAHNRHYCSSSPAIAAPLFRPSKLGTSPQDVGRVRLSLPSTHRLPASSESEQSMFNEIMRHPEVGVLHIFGGQFQHLRIHTHTSMIPVTLQSWISGQDVVSINVPRQFKEFPLHVFGQGRAARFRSSRNRVLTIEKC